MTAQFVPARSKLEATSRIYSLAGVEAEPLGPGSKEKKSVLTHLATALDLEVDRRAPKPEVGRQLAAQIDAEWDATCWSTGSTITLTGLNRLLEAASTVLSMRRPPRPTLPELLEEWSDFVPARSKLEAVNRISALTASGPEKLGPGSKERKSVLVNALAGLRIDDGRGRTKTELGAHLASSLGVGWDSSCFSTGETITLAGLNVVLAGMERSLGRAGVGLAFPNPRAEAEALTSALSDLLVEHWDGRACVDEMRQAEYSQWRQMEWPGFYFEYRGLPALIDAYGGGPRKIGAVRFDYGLGTTWDLKCHSTEARGAAPLNDRESMVAALGSGTLGLLVLTGSRQIDPSGEFDRWHREVTSTSRVARPANTGRRRARKSSFTPTELCAIVIDDVAHHDELLAAGVLTVLAQGRQAGGAPRPPKYAIRLDSTARHGIVLARAERS